MDPMTGAPTGGPPSAPVSDTSKLLAALGYPFWPVAVVALLIEPYRNEPFVRIHATQAIVVGMVFSFGWILPVLGEIAILLAAILGVIAFVHAIQGQEYRMPVVYDLVKTWAEPVNRK